MLQSIGSQRFGHDLLTDLITTTNPHSISSCFRGTKAQEVKSGSISHSVVSNSLPPLWTVAHQAPLFMGFPKQEYWNWLLFPSSEDLPDSGTEPRSPALVGRSFTTSATWEAHRVEQNITEENKIE